MICRRPGLLLLDMYLVFPVSTLLLLLVVLVGISSLAALWPLLPLVGVECLLIAGCFLIMLFVLLPCVPVRATSMRPACWTSFLDKSRNSRSAEVGCIWEVYDEVLQSVPRFFLEGVSAASEVGDVSTAWKVWSFAAEVSLLSAFQLVGGPTPDNGFKCGQGKGALSRS